MSHTNRQPSCAEKTSDITRRCCQVQALGSFGASATWTELPLLKLVGSHPRPQYASQGILVMLLGCFPCCLFNPIQQHARAAQ